VESDERSHLERAGSREEEFAVLLGS